jgi:3-dehydroquinate dehydratase-1
VIATIGTEAGWRLAEKLVSGDPQCPDWLEIRADLLLENDTKLPGIQQQLPLPFLLTVRHPSEGGKGPADSESRAAIYEEFCTGAAAVDVELAHAEDLSTWLATAKEHGIACVLSSHDFTGTPTLATLREMATQAASLGADLLKVACTTNSVAELSTLLQWVETEDHLPVAAMGMGRFGKISRPLLAQLGSRLNYGYLDAPVVPGQWPASELRRVIDSLPE